MVLTSYILLLHWLADPSNGKRERLPYNSVVGGQLTVIGYRGNRR